MLLLAVMVAGYRYIFVLIMVELSIVLLIVMFLNPLYAFIVMFIDLFNESFR